MQQRIYFFCIINLKYKKLSECITCIRNNIINNGNENIDKKVSNVKRPIKQCSSGRKAATILTSRTLNGKQVQRKTEFSMSIMHTKQTPEYHKQIETCALSFSFSSINFLFAI